MKSTSSPDVEQQPHSSFIKDKPIHNVSFEDGHVAEKVLRRKIFVRGGIKRTLYLVKWLGSDQHTWEPRHHFGDDNDAWLAFKQERHKRNSRRSTKIHRSADKAKVGSKSAVSSRKSLSVIQQETRKKNVLGPASMDRVFSAGMIDYMIVANLIGTRWKQRIIKSGLIFCRGSVNLIT